MIEILLLSGIESKHRACAAFAVTRRAVSGTRLQAVLGSLVSRLWLGRAVLLSSATLCVCSDTLLREAAWPGPGSILQGPVEAP